MRLFFLNMINTKNIRKEKKEQIMDGTNKNQYALDLLLEVSAIT